MIEKKGQAHLALLNVWWLTGVLHLKFEENGKKREPQKISRAIQPFIPQELSALWRVDLFPVFSEM